ncbi:hypothetical protein ACFTSF_06610 [Kribbella sp. NPDC056951]|uniref:hypothetical protein n=1 Tax=Kribbella sp. NPDC056951 TaxID=3345978 RepID=UPI0036436EEF
MHRTLAALLVVSALGVPVSVAQAAEAPAMTVKLSRADVAVSSLNTVPVTVTVEGSYADLPYHKNVYVQFKRIAGTGPLKEFSSMPLALVDGDGTPGVWKGTVNVPSTANGAVEATTVDGYEFVEGEPASSPAPVADPPRLTVNGVHVPKVVSLLTPKVVPYGKPWSVRYTVLDSQTGKPYGTRLKLLFGYEERCLENSPSESVLSDTNGNYVRAFPPDKYGDWTSCLEIPGKPTKIAYLETLVRRPAAISAAPSKTSAPVGSIVPVNGTVFDGAGCQVQLQRLYGATAWRVVGSGKVRDSERFTLNAQPSYKGVIYYRAYLPASPFCRPEKVPGPSNTFTIRGT